MSLLVAFDPGLRRAGVAVFQDARLVHASLVVNPERERRGPDAWLAMAKAVRTTPGLCVQVPTGGAEYDVDAFATELMQVDGRRFRPDDLFQLYGVAMWTAHHLRPSAIAGYYPRDWKGSVDADVWCRRIVAALSSTERKAIVHCAASYQHNVIDAIGIGLHHLGLGVGRRR